MNNSLLNFFKGSELIHAFCKQALVQCDEAAAKRLAAMARCVMFKPRKRVMKQGDATDDMFFVLHGSVQILVNGTRVATRVAGQHVGEMASLLHTGRTATVVTEEETVVAKVSSKDFFKVANHCSTLWRNLAIELAGRLHQRRNLIREPNSKPFIFIGSSTKTRSVAEKIREGLKGLDAEIQVWSDPGTFPASSTFIETLTCAARKSDFAVLVFGKDDVVTSRGKRQFAPRDNVVFESGLFIGSTARERTLILRPRNAKLKILTDLSGVTLLEFQKRKGQIEVGAACAQIATRVRNLGVR